MTTMSLDLDTPFALARYREGAEARLGLVVGRPHPRRSTAHALGADTLNGFLAAPDWDRLARARAGRRRSGCRSPTSP